MYLERTLDQKINHEQIVKELNKNDVFSNDYVGWESLGNIAREKIREIEEGKDWEDDLVKNLCLMRNFFPEKLKETHIQQYIAEKIIDEDTGVEDEELVAELKEYGFSLRELLGRSVSKSQFAKFSTAEPLVTEEDIKWLEDFRG
jgi:hypothetical protein